MSHRDEAPRQHLQTDLCGFNRNASHNAGRYVCLCGWVEPSCNGSQQESQKLTANSAGEPLSEMPEKPPLAYWKGQHATYTAEEFNALTGYADILHNALSQAKAEIEGLRRERYNLADGLLAWTFPAEANFDKRHNSRVWAEKIVRARKDAGER